MFNKRFSFLDSMKLRALDEIEYQYGLYPCNMPDDYDWVKRMIDLGCIEENPYEREYYVNHLYPPAPTGTAFQLLVRA